MPTNNHFDVIVLGSGIAGVSAALAAAEQGLRTLILEKDEKLGGTTTSSYGLIWVGNNHIAKAAGYSDDRDEVLRYMRFLAAGEAHEENLLAFVDRSPEALAFFQNCGIHFQLTHGLRDHYFGITPAAHAEGRTLEVELISGKELGEWRDRVRIRPNAPHYVTAEEQTSWGGVNRFSSWDQDLIRTRLEQDMRGKGLGLITHFVKALLERGVSIETGVEVEKLALDGSRVVGVITKHRGTIAAECGVVLATGGYESNAHLTAAFEGIPNHLSPCPAAVSGDGFIYGTEIGAAITVIRNSLQFFLVFEVPSDNPHEEPECREAGIAELPSPHTMVVNRAGCRFGDESYFQGMVPSLRSFDTTTHSYMNLPCFLIFDEQYAQNYSFAGRAAGAEIPDWVKRADSVTDLADQLAIDAIGLEESVRRFNDFVAVGVDADFHRGERAWRLAESAKTNARKNHSLGSIASAPYYGIELRPSVWSSAGLLTNAQGQVLHQRGHAIAGLYATGNTAARVEFGAGYQAGLVMASGMTFGYLAVEHMLQARVTS